MKRRRSQDEEGGGDGSEAEAIDKAVPAGEAVNGEGNGADPSSHAEAQEVGIKREDKEEIKGEGSDGEDDDEFRAVQYSSRVPVRRGAECPYLDTISRPNLDFDFEKCCSVSLSPVNVYACLVCGKYFQARALPSSLPSTHFSNICKLPGDANGKHSPSLPCRRDGLRSPTHTLMHLKCATTCS